MIKTSVIIPVYNTRSYLEECIESVFKQTQKEIEVIAINDGSTDDSWEVLLCLKKKYPELIIIKQENYGQGYARNVGIEIAKGEYIYFLDSDDYILKDTLESCYECASKNELDIVLFDAFVFEDSAERKPVEPNNCDRHAIIKEREEIFLGISFLQRYYQKTYIPTPWSMYCSASFIKKNNIRFLEGVYFEDNEFYCRVMTMAKRVMYIPQKFYQYRCRKTSTTGSEFDLRRARDHIEVISAMADLKALDMENGWPVIKKISLNLLMYVAGVCSVNNLYDQDSRLYMQIWNVWMKICGGTIEKQDDLADINCIYRIARLFPDSDFGEIKKVIVNKQKQMLIQVLNQLPLNQEGVKIAIYGSGKYTGTVLDFYENWVGDIKADVIFVDSYIKNSNIKYRGYSVYPIEQIHDKNIDYILISSSRHENEMRDTIESLYGNKFVVIMLYGDRHIQFV